MKLGDYVEIKSGKLNSDQAVDSGAYPFFTCAREVLRINKWEHDREAVLLGGNNANAVFPVFYYNGKFTARQRVYVIWSIDTDALDNRYLYYLIQTATQQFGQFSLGTTTKFITLGMLTGLDAPLPHINEQRAIGSVLGSLDDKIELNRRMNRTLEQMAAAIFEAWFVDFEPVRAKASGAASFPGMPQPVFDALPATFANSELGPNPEGWVVKPLEECAEAMKGLSYKGAGLLKDPAQYCQGLPLHNLNSVLEGGGYKYAGIKYYGGDFKERHVLEPGDVIVTNTEQGFEYRLIGFPAIVPGCFGDRGLFSHHLFRIRPLDEAALPKLFLYHAVMSWRLREEIIGHTNGTTVNMLAADGLQRPRIVLPPQALAGGFDSIVAPIHQLVEQNHGESKTLSETRDALLPKLLSGEVRVSDTAEMEVAR